MSVSVSIVIPVYNGEKTIKRCILSILEQTFTDFEIIVVDDGSVDNTLSVVKAVKDNRIRIISQKNMGQGEARNTGIKASSGKYISFVDCDDTVNSSMIEKMYTASEAVNSDICQCNIFDVYEDGTRKIQLDSIDETVDVKQADTYFKHYVLEFVHSFEVCNKMFRKSFIEENDLKFYDTKKYFSEDLLFNLMCIECLTRISFIEQPLYNYFQHSDSHLHKNAEERLLKICDLFSFYLSGLQDMKLSNQVKRLATLIILLYCVPVIAVSEKIVRKILKRSEIKDYIYTSGKYTEKKLHRLLMWAILYMPMGVKLFIIKKHYSY